MSTLKAFIKKHPVLSYFIITFLISWGGFILFLGPAGFQSTNIWEESTFGYAVLSMLSGPTIAGLLITWLVEGGSGIRGLIARLITWKAKICWYLFAILLAPVLMMLAIFSLSLPYSLLIAENKIAVLMSGVFAGLSVVFEEIGWTGVAIPILRRRFNVLKTGLIVGLLWGAWHLLQQIYIGGTYAGGVPLGIYFAVAVFNAVAGLTAYRILLVWIYDRTKSFLVTTLMHSSLSAFNVFILRPEATGRPFLIFGLLFTALQWLVVAGVMVTNRKQFLKV